MSSLGFFPPNLINNVTSKKIIDSINKNKNKNEINNNPPPPRLPSNFSWKGSYLVPDLGISVPLIWNGNNNNIQMIVGNESAPIYFTNLIYNGFLYTLTYKWPNVTETPSCLKLLPFALDDLNNILATSVFVGEEIIKENGCCYTVNHFRFTIVLPPLPPGNHFRFAISEADIYVDINDPTKIRKILHFGYQNLLDPQLDEWIIISKFNNEPGNIMVPDCCINNNIPC